MDQLQQQLLLLLPASSNHLRIRLEPANGKHLQMRQAELYVIDVALAYFVCSFYAKADVLQMKPQLMP